LVLSSRAGGDFIAKHAASIERSRRLTMSRKILLITTDQMRHDALGCNGGVVARTPVIDALARNGINYKRA
jgi:hypothetical protein